MAKEIKAYQANDGSLHNNECEAATRDLELIVGNSPLAENQPFAKKLVDWLANNAKTIRLVLEAHERACPQTISGEQGSETRQKGPATKGPNSGE